MADHNELGKWGEEMAREYYIGLGYAIFGMNVKVGSIEIDMIAMKDNRLSFVEVKTRSTLPDNALEAINPRKMQRMARAADSFIRTNRLPYEPQFDIVIVTGSPTKGPRISHYPDAFLPPLTTR
ncbi:MAG: YraN family protein [Bacteroidales bacterium]|nr:YraN family protein [Bacteroidales bacterium]